MLTRLFCMYCGLLAVWGQSLAQKIVQGPAGELFRVCTVASELSDPWEIIYGPDQYLWVTEARGYRVSRIHPVTGAKEIVLDLNDRKDFPRYDLLPKEKSGGKPWPQSGLMGMALHPNLLKGAPYVYIAYLYAFTGAGSAGDGCLPGSGGCFFTTRIERYTYDSSSRQLVHPEMICDTIPGSNDHNAGRLLMAPVQNQLYLFYTVGDMGAGQYSNAGRTNHAQQTDSYEGKILRFNALPDKDTGAYDRWIPNDNPFNLQTQNAVWSYGHRNTQGICYATIANTTRIYAAEHGPFSDDEINIVEKGKNYGHPLVIGYNDNNYNGLAAGVSTDSTLPGQWNTSYPLITDEHANATAIGKSKYRDPIYSLYPASNDSLQHLFATLRSTDINKPDWPSEAPSSVAVYAYSTIPGWRHSLLITTLKGGKLLRLSLNKTGDRITGAPLSYFKGAVRFRDLAIATDGRTIYLATDSSTVSSGPTSSRQPALEQRGSILSFTYIGNAAAMMPAPPPGTRQKLPVKAAGRSYNAAPAR